MIGKETKMVITLVTRSWDKILDERRQLEERSPRVRCGKKIIDHKQLLLWSYSLPSILNINKVYYLLVSFVTITIVIVKIYT